MLSENDHQGLFSIGSVSELCNISVKTLRYYDSIGLLPAEYKSNATGYRYYSKQQVAQLFFIHNLKNLGFSLQEIKATLHAKDNDCLIVDVQKKLELIMDDIRKLSAQHKFGTAFLERLRDQQALTGTHLPENSRIEELILERIPSTNTVFTRQTQKNYINSEINIDARGRLLKLIQDHHATRIGPFTSTYHNPPLQQFYSSTCDYEISVPILEELDAPNFKKTEEYTALTTIFVGNYQSIVTPHLKMMRWIQDNGYTISGSVSEIFLITPIDTGNEEDFITKIIFPIKKLDK